MDRELSQTFKRKRIVTTILITSICLAVIVAAFITFRGTIRPAVNHGEIEIGTADKGTIEATISASGTVIPQYEFTITSPIHAKIEKVLHAPGELINARESILSLNKETTLSNYTKMLDEQAANHNKIDQLKLSLERSLGELETQYTIKEMNIQSLETALDHERSLLSIGSSTAERVKQAGLNLQISKLELKQLKNQIGNQKKAMQNDMKSLGFQISIQNKNIAESNKKLNLAEVRSPAKGMITWVIDKIGIEVGEGAELVRVADMSSFKIDAKISDEYAANLKPGGTVIVRIDKTDLRGQITNIMPEVDNGMIKFFVGLNKNNDPILRSNLKVDVFVVIAVKDNVVRVKNGPAFNGSDQQKVFVIKGNEAVSRNISVGISNFDKVEIRSGLQPGEQIIVTEMNDFKNMDKVIIKN
ncbi:efflux RND transporter periplasmic adaptor subunit [Pedobacter frigoris]|uniref:HlyD family efflux transporter periplasmic adaptor subunit n=1 Tax=Pedobacter frigoris TaxID=2571272 RepID=A0A4U1CLK6_9SPHI|nr:HlyD family efflux transporter periplasmic adaptor subunit [Pedobacter frigoris]TKC08697.1 HlyD family efflux transporter periplasmic adaptor subunit [Pedobacter frigoris]